MAAATAGLLATAPAAALPSLLAGAEDSPALVEGGTAELGGEMEGTIVAHVRDVATGEISIFSGNGETVIRDPAMAARLVRRAP